MRNIVSERFEGTYYYAIDLMDGRYAFAWTKSKKDMPEHLVDLEKNGILRSVYIENDLPRVSERAKDRFEYLKKEYDCDIEKILESFSIEKLEELKNLPVRVQYESATEYQYYSSAWNKIDQFGEFEVWKFFCHLDWTSKYGISYKGRVDVEMDNYYPEGEQYIDGMKYVFQKLTDTK